jgi:hypothetical protein
MQECTSQREWQNQKINRSSLMGIKRLSSQRLSGTKPVKAEHGIVSTESACGNSASAQTASALDAEQSFSRCGAIQSTARKDAQTESVLKNTRLFLQSALAAASSFLTTNTKIGRIVPVGVQTNTCTVKTYNLTLDRDNVYYANGILVANCADAFCLTFMQAAEHRGKQSYEPQYFTDT